MSFTTSFIKSDQIGALASTLCMIHCIATPFLFVTQLCAFEDPCCEASPTWWQSLDYVFLVVSFFAIFQATRTTTKEWIKPAMWVSWALLLTVISNEKTQWFTLFEEAIYIPALMLVALHLYNLKYCQCKDDGCCAN